MNLSPAVHFGVVLRLFRVVLRESVWSESSRSKSLEGARAYAEEPHSLNRVSCA